MRLGLDAPERVLAGGRQRRAVLAGQLRVALDDRERGAQLVADVGEEPSGATLGVGEFGQRGVDVLQQQVQCLAHHADLAGRVGVAHPGGDAVVGVGQRQGGHVGGGGRHPAQRPQRVADHQDRAERGDQQRHRHQPRNDQHLGGEQLGGPGQRDPGDQPVPVDGAALQPVVAGGAEGHGAGDVVGEVQGLQLGGELRIGGAGLPVGEHRGVDHRAVIEHGDEVARSLADEVGERLLGGAFAALREGVAERRQGARHLRVVHRGHVAAQAQRREPAEGEHHHADHRADPDHQSAAHRPRPPGPPPRAHRGGRSR